MNILVFDTATKTEIVAVSGNNKVFHTAEVVSETHSKTIFHNIDNLLKKSGLCINDINLIGVGLGPGSFTGIRIAVTTARMLAQLLNSPLVGIKTQEIYAASVEANIDDNILIAIDAKKDRVFGALYKRDTNPLSPVEIVPPGDYPIEVLLEKADYNKTFIAGDGAEKYLSKISRGLSNPVFLPDFLPSGGIACKLIHQIYNKNPGNYENIYGVVPFYARKSDAEIVKGY